MQSTPPSSAPDGSGLAALLSVLDLEPLEVNLFRGVSPSDGWQRVFGGQVLGQALVAAGRTVEDGRHVHSLQAYFLLGGDPKHPIVYDVERTRDGGSFTTRRVKAIQHGRIIFAMSASFHKYELGFDHQTAMPDVPGPDGLINVNGMLAARLADMPDAMRAYWSRPHAFEFRPVDVKRYLNREPAAGQQYVWLRANSGLAGADGSLPDDPRIHANLLAYASDFTLLDTALIPHGKLMFDRDLQLASLDHAMWFHRPFRADDWLLYAQDSPTATGARGFCRGSVFTRDGRLVASVAQEGMIRQRIEGTA
jgi:acyl-CoA thioesterase II